MSNHLVEKLGRFIALDDREVEALERLSRNPRSMRVDADLIKEGTKPDSVFLLLEGWGYRYTVLPDGRRQIFGYLLPGDLCDVHVFMLERMDHSIGLLSDAKVVAVPADEMLEVINRHAGIERALWIATLVDEAVLRQWVVNVGQRDAFTRIAHLFCELQARMGAVGLVNEGNQFDLPLTQTDLADTVGLTSVHVNRTLKRLRDSNFITLGKGRLTILDPERLRKASGFRSEYLRLGGTPAYGDLRSRLSRVAR